MWCCGRDQNEYDSYEEDGSANGSADAHTDSIQVNSTTAIVGCALLTILRKAEV